MTVDFIHQVEPYVTEHEADAVGQYLSSGGWLTEFRKTEEFEKMLADFSGVKYSTVVTSGTVALYLSLLASGIGRGDKVIVPNYTMIATINAVKWAGAEPVIIDVEPSTLCINTEKIKPDPSCKALIHVSINGRSGKMAEVVEFCEDNNLVLIEDACQSLGSKCGDRYLGTFGEIGVFSFTPHKIITTGQGGATVTDDEGLYRRIKKLKDFHRTAPGTDWHDGLGYNFKFTDLQAVVGIEQMKIIEFR
ncbi:MAG: DegT/DnrJ/EryC1/StrS family aminotransferase, partial [Planctomycetota bacterium]